MAELSPIRILYSSARYSYRALFGWLNIKSYLTLKILAPLTQVIFFAMVGLAAGRDPRFFVIGNATQITVTSGIFGLLSVIASERAQGTLAHLMIVPTNTAITFYGRSLFMILDSLSSVLVSFVIGGWLFQLSFDAVNWPWLIGALIVTSFAVSGMGLFLGTLGLIGTDLNLILNIALAILLVLTGANFPINELPVFLQTFARILPITHGLMAIRVAAEGQSQGMGGLLIWEAVIGAGYMAAGYGLFVIAERHARRQGSFELF